MADGIWILTDEGEFILDEPYKSILAEAKLYATQAWTSALFEYLADKCPYTTEELKEALLARSGRDEDAHDIVDSFVLEALIGDL